jgi:hypothetical protein
MFDQYFGFGHKNQPASLGFGYGVWGLRPQPAG